ncbi:hypothetical protein ACQ4LE_000556 [Meloidogyne hapla]
MNHPPPPPPFSLPPHPQHPQHPPAFPFPLDPATLAAFQPFIQTVQTEHRRKNATREVTAPLKQWLNMHRKNPYPTKAEKTLLAIVTHMTMTQVSTWFANARRRLKKENKMEWSPRARPDEDCDEGDGEEVDVDAEEDQHQQHQGMNDFFMLMGNRQHQNLIGQQWPVFNDQHRIVNNERIVNEHPSKSTSPTSSSNNLKEKEEEEEENEGKEKKMNGINERREKIRKRKIWSIADTLGNREDDEINKKEYKEEIKEEVKEESGCTKQPEFSRNASLNDLRPQTAEKHYSSSPLSSKNSEIKQQHPPIYSQNNKNNNLLSPTPIINGCSTPLQFRNVESILQQHQQQQLLMLGLHPQLALGGGMNLPPPQLHPGMAAGVDQNILALALAHHHNQQQQTRQIIGQHQQHSQPPHLQLAPFVFMAAQHLAASIAGGQPRNQIPNSGLPSFPTTLLTFPNDKAEPSIHNENNGITVTTSQHQQQKQNHSKSDNSSPVHHLVNNENIRKRTSSSTFISTSSQPSLAKKQQRLTEPLQNGAEKEEKKSCDQLEKSKEN